MPKLVTKFKYIKPGKTKKPGNYARYVALREGVEMNVHVCESNPASEKQKLLIADLMQAFPDSKDLHEYKDFLSAPNMKNARELIMRVLETNADEVGGNKTYADYIATRPRAERLGSHGLFTNEGVYVQLSKVSAQLNAYTGNVWTVILSLRREDAERLGFQSAARWQTMLQSKIQELSENFHIPMQHLKWYAAFHNESHHPHVHMLVYSDRENEGHLDKAGVNALRSSFAADIFEQDHLAVYRKETFYRDQLRQDAERRITKIASQIRQDPSVSPILEEKMLQLAHRLSKTSGKKKYGYLKRDVKDLVDSIVDELQKDERIAALYALWYEQREAVIGTYTDHKPQRLPLSENTEFKPIRNAVVTAAVNLLDTGDKDAQAGGEKPSFLSAVHAGSHRRSQSSSYPSRSAGLAVLRLLQHTACFMQDKCSDEKRKSGYEEQKLLKTINEKKQAHGLHQG